jgi:exopolysaccharide biosynthesis WecB/TagA/CpsF family protein
MRTERTTFVDIGFDGLRVDQLLSRLENAGGDRSYGYLVTPNVDHVVRLQRGGAGAAELANIYRDAEYCLCDSKVLARLARLCGVRLEVIPGSDLTELVFTRVLRDGDRIAVVGGDTETIEALAARFPRLEIVHHSPPMGLATNAEARRRAATFIAEHKARFSFICVGSPQQELIAAEVAAVPGARGLALCVGAALLFLTGRQSRAPRIMRRLGLEWAHRLLIDPRKMWRRYLVDGPRIFLLAYRWAQKSA